MSDRQPPLQAWYYRTADDGCEIVFARSEAGARARMARQQGLCWEDTEGELIRAEVLDRYAPGPVQDDQLHEAGWSVFCRNCEHLLDADECWRCNEEHDEPALVVTDGHAVFCSEQCRDAHNAYRARIKEKKAAAAAALLKAFPFVVPLGSWVGGPGECQCWSKDHENIITRFKVPGGSLSEKTSDGNAYHNTFCFGCRQAFVARGDYDAFQEWRETKPDCVVEGKL